MSNRALELLIDQAKEQEQQARLLLLAAKKELQAYYAQRDQIESYRLEYCRQMGKKGKQGFSAYHFRHLQRFINQLDNTLDQQKHAVINFERNVETRRAHWLACQQKTKTLMLLLEKRQKSALAQQEKREQKENDEFAAAMCLRKNRRLF